MANLKPTNYYQVSAWMITDLKLKSNELNAFAIIYGFSQDGQNSYTGSLNYLSEWLGTSKQTTINVLDKLIEKNYILKEQYEVNKVKFNKFRVNIDYINQIIFKNINFTTGQNFIHGVVKNLDEGSQKIRPRVVKKLDESSQKIRPNNNNIYKYINIDIDKEIENAMTTDLQKKEVLDIYMNNINYSINSIEYERLIDDIDEYGVEWVKEAITRAVMQGKRKLGYIEAILNNWKVNGYDEYKTKNKVNTSSSSKLSDAEQLALNRAPKSLLDEFLEQEGIKKNG